MKNQQLAQLFADGATKGTGSNLFIEHNVIYSYGHHWPIALRLDGGLFILNVDKRSVTTTIHKNRVHNALAARYANKIIDGTGEAIKRLINEGVKTEADMINRALEVTA